MRFGALMLVLMLSGPPLGRALPAGSWGGQHVVLEVGERGADLEFDCARGRIDSPIQLDVRGDFDVAGTFTPEHGGPIRRDEQAHAAGARYVGHVDGQTMELTVSRG